MGYLTKNEAGISRLLKAISDQRKELSNMDIVNQISVVLDKNREVSIQEAVYRALSLPMTKSSIKVKFISTLHPNYRDGLLKTNLEDLKSDESIFYKSLHQYYECRNLECIDGIFYEDYEKEKDYWEKISLSEFWSLYDLVYSSGGSKEKDTNLIPLKNRIAFIKRRNDRCVLRYHLNRENDEDFKRGLLILFYPFTNEMNDIHLKDVHELYKEHEESILDVKSIFEKHKVITDIVDNIQRDIESMKSNEEDVEEEEEFVDEETTTAEEIEDFQKWAKQEAKKSLMQCKTLTTIPKVENLRKTITQLNDQQRRIFDDVCERLFDYESETNSQFYLYIAGDAGTGKSFVCRLIIEAIKYLKLSPGDDLKMPKCIVMAPTANASYIINGKTIESALRMHPKNTNRFVKSNREQISNLTFLYQDVTMAFCDEISMVGSSKFTKMNFQLQDIMGCNQFMGGLSFIAVGDFRQLPPVRDGYIFQNNSLDGRPRIAPSHWDEHFRIYYLTEKMRSQKDPQFSAMCDRIGNGTFTNEDILFLQSRILDTESENCNENFKTGFISIIVTTNKVRQEINNHKLKALIQSKETFISKAEDQCTNIEDPPDVPENLAITQTGGLEKSLELKEEAPIIITCNHPKAKYKEDGLVNGARGFVDSIQLSKSNPEIIDAIWIVFNDSRIGSLMRFDYRKLKNIHRPKNSRAVPIFRIKRSFAIQNGEIRYQRCQFPLTLAYAITSYKCQGDSLKEVIVDFSSDGEKRHIQNGSFYVAITRVSQREDIYLKSFDKSYITFNKKVEEKIKSMRKTRSYNFKKIYLNDQIFKLNREMKLGYLNIRGFLESNHAEYLDSDKNLLELDFLVIAETWLTGDVDDTVVKRKLENWSVVKRFDASDKAKHMGLLLLSSINSRQKHLVWSLEEKEGFKSKKTLLYQGLCMLIKDFYKKVIFLYVKETPSLTDTKLIAKLCRGYDIVIGDLNLNVSNLEDKKKLDIITGDSRFMALRESTTINHHQLDHILLEKSMRENTYATSFFNFSSDHKSICLRIASEENEFNESFKERIFFNSDFHNKKREQVSVKNRSEASEEPYFPVKLTSKVEKQSILSTDECDTDLYFKAVSRVTSLGFQFSTSQPYTPGDGNCMMHALLDQLRKTNHPDSHYIASSHELRISICNELINQLKKDNIYWVLDVTPQTWQDQMLQDGQWGDQLFLQIVANVFNVNILLIPLNPESAHNGMYTEIRSVHGGEENNPLYMLYFEEWITAGHYQSIEPETGTQNNRLLSHFRGISRK